MTNPALQIALPVADLKPALIGLGKIVPKRVTLPVLGSIKSERLPFRPNSIARSKFSPLRTPSHPLPQSPQTLSPSSTDAR